MSNSAKGVCSRTSSSASSIPLCIIYWPHRTSLSSLPARWLEIPQTLNEFTISFCLFCSSHHAFTTLSTTSYFEGFGILSKDMEPVDSLTWNMDCMYLHHDLLRESLKGQLIENSSACILLVQPFVFFALNSFVMLSAACALKLSMTPTHPDPLLAQGIMSATWKKTTYSVYLQIIKIPRVEA